MQLRASKAQRSNLTFESGHGFDRTSAVLQEISKKKRNFEIGISAAFTFSGLMLFFKMH